MSNPLVTICIPTYNRERYVIEAVRSALAQVYDPIEILVFDDASTDQTVAQLHKFSDPRLKIQTKKISSGLVDNWNTALHHASGDYIKWLASDDLLMPSCVSTMMQTVKEQHADFVCCSRKLMDTEGNIKKVVRLAKKDTHISGKRWASHYLRFPQNTLGEPTATLFSRRLADKVGGFDPKLNVLLDADYWIRLLLEQDGYFLAKPLCKVRVHPGSHLKQATTQGWSIDDLFYLIDKYHTLKIPDLPIDRKALRYQFASRVQRQIKQYYKKGNRKQAGVLLNRLRSNLTLWEQVTYFIRFLSSRR